VSAADLRDEIAESSVAGTWIYRFDAPWREGRKGDRTLRDLSFIV